MYYIPPQEKIAPLQLTIVTSTISNSNLRQIKARLHTAPSLKIAEVILQEVILEANSFIAKKVGISVLPITYSVKYPIASLQYHYLILPRRPLFRLLTFSVINNSGRKVSVSDLKNALFSEDKAIISLDQGFYLKNSLANLRYFEVSFRAGYVDFSNCPADLRRIFFSLISHFYLQRGEAGLVSKDKQIPQQTLIDLRHYRETRV